MKRASEFSPPLIYIGKLLICLAFVFYNYTSYAQLTTFWGLWGNSLISGQFLGTTNSEPLKFKTDSIERARITPGGNFGIGLNMPQQILHVHDNRLLTPNSQIDQNSTTTKGIGGLYAYSAIQLTNNKTGVTEKDGLLFYTNENNGGIHLQEQGNFELKAGKSIITLLPDNKCSFFSSGASDASIYIYSLNNNGLNIKLQQTISNQISYGLNIESNKNSVDLMKGTVLNKTVYTLNGKGEAIFGYGTERLSLGNTQGLGDKYATGYIGFNITKEGNNWNTQGDGANNGAFLIYADMAGALRFVPVATTGGSQNQLTDTYIRDNTKVFITRNGNVGIGTENPGLHKLAVDGVIGARRVRVTELAFGADFVFCPTYKLKSLSDVEDYVKTHKHLPDVPSEAQMKEEGIDLTDMNILLLQKIEELYLYVFELEKKVKELSK